MFYRVYFFFGDTYMKLTWTCYLWKGVNAFAYNELNPGNRRTKNTNITPA